MKLTELEARFVTKWQRQQRSWRWVRWFNVILSVILIVFAAWNLLRLLNLSDEATATAIGWFAPFAWLSLLAPSGWLGYTLGRWHGDIRTQLLLRLISAHEKDDA